MSAITYKYMCGNCHNEFSAPEVPEGSYGSFVMRTDISREPRYLDAMDDAAFSEVTGMVAEHPLVHNLTSIALADLQQAIFSITCDPSPTNNESFEIGLLPKCPTCGSCTIESWLPVTPITEWALPAIGHSIWNTKTRAEKAALVDRSVRQFLNK